MKGEPGRKGRKRVAEGQMWLAGVPGVDHAGRAIKREG